MKFGPMCLLAASSVLTLGQAASADVLWEGNFETGDLGQWDSLLNETTGTRRNINVVDDPVFEGAHAAEIVIHPDALWPGNNHNRVELHYDAARTGEGETTYFSFRFRLPAEAQASNDIAYWESNQSYNQSMAFWLFPGESGTELLFRSNLPASRQHFRGPVSINEWHQLAMQILWSQDPMVGRVSVWLDGEKIVDGVSAKTKPDANPVFVQLGYHRNAAAPPVERIYIDAAMEATTLKEVLEGRASGDSDEGGCGVAGRAGTQGSLLPALVLGLWLARRRSR